MAVPTGGPDGVVFAVVVVVDVAEVGGAAVVDALGVCAVGVLHPARIAVRAKRVGTATVDARFVILAA